MSTQDTLPPLPKTAYEDRDSEAWVKEPLFTARHMQAYARAAIAAQAQQAQGVPTGWRLVAFPVEWTFGADWFKSWCGNWFGPDSDDDYLRKAVLSLLENAPDAAPQAERDSWGDLWLKHDDDLRYVRRVLESGRAMTDQDKRAAIDIIHGLRVVARGQAAPQAEPEPLSGLPNSDAESWLRHRTGIIEACRAEGYTIVTTSQGVRLMKLGKVEAQADQPLTANQMDRWATALENSSIGTKGDAPQAEPQPLQSNCIAAGPTATDVALWEAMNEAEKYGLRTGDKLIRKALNERGYYLVRSFKKPGTCERLLASVEPQTPAPAPELTDDDLLRIWRKHYPKSVPGQLTAMAMRDAISADRASRPPAPRAEPKKENQ